MDRTHNHKFQMANTRGYTVRLPSRCAYKRPRRSYDLDGSRKAKTEEDMQLQKHINVNGIDYNRSRNGPRKTATSGMAMIFSQGIWVDEMIPNGCIDGDPPINRFHEKNLSYNGISYEVKNFLMSADHFGECRYQ
ncbi:hypothetical protein FQA39_LY19147 [Lamprigera yunnana]|nr:hypothetical protein FQA39_LY19147 [Lamprigera yunnana]